MFNLKRPLNEPKLGLQAKSNEVFETDPVDLADGLLLRQFRTFVHEVFEIINTVQPLKTENEKIKQGENRVRDGEIESEQNSFNKLAAEVNDSLSKLIEVQHLELLRKGSIIEQKRTEEIKYLKAAVADELLLISFWPARKYYKDHLIETRLFGTGIAGEKIFDEIDILLSTPPGRDPQIDLLYLFALSIGYEGKFRGLNPEKKIGSIMRELFRHLARREPALFINDGAQNGKGRRITESAYDNIITNTKPVRVFRVSKQTIVFIIIFIGILALSQVIYVFLTQPLRDSLQSISFNSERGNIQTMLPGGVVSSNYEDKGSFHG